MDNCHVNVITFGEEADLDLEGTEVLHPEWGTKPRVFYRGMPKKFIAATVYDPETKEVVIGAQVTATGEGGTFTAVTDDWGDFWLRGLPDADWTVTIEAGGKRKVVETSTKEKDQGWATSPWRKPPTASAPAASPGNGRCGRQEPFSMRSTNRSRKRLRTMCFRPAEVSMNKCPACGKLQQAHRKNVRAVRRAASAEEDQLRRRPGEARCSKHRSTQRTPNPCRTGRPASARTPATAFSPSDVTALPQTTRAARGRKRSDHHGFGIA